MSSKDKLRSIATICGLLFLVSPVIAGDKDQADIAYEHYICSAYEQHGVIDADVEAKCVKLANDGFDLAAWQDANPEQADALQQKALTIFR